MDTMRDESWTPWRTPSPLHGRRPTKIDLATAADTGMTVDDVLPYPKDAQNAGLLRLLIVGTNPSPWAAAVQAPFARPGNRFWKALEAGGITGRVITNANGMRPGDERLLAMRGVGITNIVARPTSKSSELSAEELRAGRNRLVHRVGVLQPSVVAFTGITAFRIAFEAPAAALGRQPTRALQRWPEHTQLWVVPDPSGLNAHESVASLGAKWAQVWAAAHEAPGRADAEDLPQDVKEDR